MYERALTVTIAGLLGLHINVENNINKDIGEIKITFIC